MPLQNRVDPFGTIIRTSARGTFMGNRGGALHNDAREIVRSHKGTRWITCVLEFKNRHRTVMSPRRYTELFFLDEAVAFAAGHRPCAECRRARLEAFKNSWGFPVERGPLRVPEIDAILHRERIAHRGEKVVWESELSALPDGSFVAIDGSAYLLWNDSLHRWTPERYTEKLEKPERMNATVLTPRPIVECFRKGYRPEVHVTADNA